MRSGDDRLEPRQHRVRVTHNPTLCDTVVRRWLFHSPSRSRRPLPLPAVDVSPIPIFPFPLCLLAESFHEMRFVMPAAPNTV